MRIRVPSSCIDFTKRPAGKLNRGNMIPIIIVEFYGPPPLKIGPEPPQTVIGLRIPFKLNMLFRSSSGERITVTSREIPVSKKGGTGIVLFPQGMNIRANAKESPENDFDSFKFKVRVKIRALSLQTGSERAYFKKICITS